MERRGGETWTKEVRQSRYNETSSFLFPLPSFSVRLSRFLFLNFILDFFFISRFHFLSSTFRFLTGRRCAPMRLAATIDGSVAEGPGAQFIFYSNCVYL